MLEPERETPPPLEERFRAAAERSREVGSVAAWLRGVDWALLVLCGALATLAGVRGSLAWCAVLGATSARRGWTLLRPRLHARRALREATRSHYTRPLAYRAPAGWTVQTLQDTPPQFTGVRLASADAWVEVTYWAEGVLSPDRVERWLESFEPGERTHDPTERRLEVSGTLLVGAEVTVTRWLSGWVALALSSSTPRGVLAVRSVRSLYTPLAVIERVLAGVELDEGAASTESPPG